MDNVNFQNQINPISGLNSLRLLSIHKASKLLGIRFKSAKNIALTGKIKYIRIGKRIKIPYMNLVKYLEWSSVDSNSGNVDHSSTEDISNRIDELIEVYRST